MILNTCCFTGHRTQKLPWKDNEEDLRCLAVKEALKKEITAAVENGYNTFLCGMALGFDLICAETVIALKKQSPHIKLIAALPCLSQDRFWRERDRKRYRAALEKADAIRCIYDEYIGSECMLERNRYMVNNSSLLIALYYGGAGGAKYTVEYAKKRGLNVITIDGR